MWKRGGRSSALDRAQVLLSAKRNSRGDPESVQGSTAKTRLHTRSVGGSVPANTHDLLSDLSDLSSISLALEHGADTVGSAVPRKSQDLRPPNSLDGGGSRFLKKAPPPATISSQSPVSKSQMQHLPEPRYVSSSQRGSQTAALSKLAEIESRIRSRMHAQEHDRQGPKSAKNRASDSPPPASHSLEAHAQLSAQSCSDQSLKGKRFLKNNTAVAVINSNNATARSPKGPDLGIRFGSKAADAIDPLVDLETKSVRIVSGVSLESDEEDMRKLLGDSLESVDNSALISGRPFSKTANKMLSQSIQRVHSIDTPPPAAFTHSSPSRTAPPYSPASPSRRSSPFRFTSQAQAHFSPSLLSPSPSPPCVSPPRPGRLNSPPRAGSPQRSFSSMSSRSEVLSLEELFPVGPGSEDPHSEMSVVSSEDFKINVMTLDDLVPANLVLTEETPGKEIKAKLGAPVPGSPNTHEQLARLKEKEKKKRQQPQVGKDMLDYQSDFESESRTEPDYSASKVSEHLQGHRDEDEIVTEVPEKVLDSDLSCGRTEDDYSSTFSDTSRSYTSRTPDRSQTLSRSRNSRSSVSHGNQTISHQSRRRASTRKVLKEAAVQTLPDPLAYTWSAGLATLGPAAGVAYLDPTPVAAHTLRAEMVEALSTSNPAAFVVNEMLKQQLAMTRRFIESSRHLHSSLVQSLETPNYRYTTLEDIKEYIGEHRPPKLTMGEALEEVVQEMRDYHHVSH